MAVQRAYQSPLLLASRQGRCVCGGGRDLPEELRDSVAISRGAFGTGAAKRPYPSELGLRGWASKPVLASWARGDGQAWQASRPTRQAGLA
jgi:hypothetical protein